MFYPYMWALWTNRFFREVFSMKCIYRNGWHPGFIWLSLTELQIYFYFHSIRKWTTHFMLVIWASVSQPLCWLLVRKSIFKGQDVLSLVSAECSVYSGHQICPNWFQFLCKKAPKLRLTVTFVSFSKKPRKFQTHEKILCELTRNNMMRTKLPAFCNKHVGNCMLKKLASANRETENNIMRAYLFFLVFEI